MKKYIAMFCFLLCLTGCMSQEEKDTHLVEAVKTQNIQEIQCLSNGTLSYADTKTAEFDIQIQITYLDNNEEGGDISL